MRKFLCVLCLVALLSGCDVDKMKMKTCSYTNEVAQSHVDITAYYTKDNVPKIIVEMKQQFDDDIVSKMGSEKIKESIRNSIYSTIGSETQMEMEYDDKKKEVMVKVIFFTKEMDEKSLKGFNLHESVKINKFVEKFKKLGYTCKDVSE